MAQQLLSRSAQNARVDGWRRIILELLNDRSPRPIDAVLDETAKRARVIPSDIKVALSEAEIDDEVSIDYLTGTVRLTA